MRRLTALPRESYRVNPEQLRARQNRLVKQRKNTSSVARLLALAVAAQIRRELRNGR